MMKQHMEEKEVEVKEEIVSEDACCCGHQTSNKIDFLSHIALNHIGSEKAVVYLCSTCTFSTGTKRELKQHMLEHVKLEAQFTCAEEPPDITEAQQSPENKIVIKTEELFTCAECNFGASKKCTLKKHIVQVHGEELNLGAYNCNLCLFVGDTRDQLHTHFAAVHDNKKLFSCTRCSFKAAFEVNLLAHIETVHDSKNYFSCILCSYQTNVEKNLKLHIAATHRKSKLYPCRLCSYKARNERYLNIHLATKHKEQLQLRCSKCKFVAETKKSLAKHIHVEHSCNKFVCEECGFASKQMNSLKRHMKDVHNDDQAYKCDMCPFTAGNKVEFLAHLSDVHLMVKKFKCFRCNTEFAEKGTLDNHTVRIHQECDDCDFVAMFRGDYQRHREIHHREARTQPDGRAAKPHVCSACGFRASDRGKLRTHIRAVHYRERPFVCSICNYKAAEKGRLNKHIASVHRVCHFCGYEPARQGDNRKHMIRMHNKTLLPPITS